jgi:hypothetical protein
VCIQAIGMLRRYCFDPGCTEAVEQLLGAAGQQQEPSAAEVGSWHAISPAHDVRCIHLHVFTCM